MTDATEKRVALVTGGAARVGAAIVRTLAASGYRVGIHANRSLDKATQLVDELSEAGYEAAAFGAELRATKRRLGR